MAKKRKHTKRHPKWNRPEPFSLAAAKPPQGAIGGIAGACIGDAVPVAPPERRAKYLSNDALGILRDMERHVVEVEHAVRRAGITLEHNETYTTQTPRNHIQHLRIVNDFISHLNNRLRRATETLSTLI